MKRKVKVIQCAVSMEEKEAYYSTFIDAGMREGRCRLGHFR